MNVLITGSSRGIGRITASTLAQKGYRVWATMRDPGKRSAFDHLPQEVRNNIEIRILDVTKQDLIDIVVKEIIDLDGKIDVLINNAGYGFFAPIELTTEKEMHKQFDVNVYGVVRMIQAVLPHMRKQKTGHIINISSIAGVVSNPALGIYSATKHSIETISASLAATIFAWNIKVTVVEPGPVATEFAEVMQIGSRLKEENPYQTFTKQYRQLLVDKLKDGQDPQEVADLIAEIIEKKHPDFRYQTSERMHTIAAKFIKDTTGNEWLDMQKDELKDMF